MEPTLIKVLWELFHLDPTDERPSNAIRENLEKEMFSPFEGELFTIIRDFNTREIIGELGLAQLLGCDQSDITAELFQERIHPGYRLMTEAANAVIHRWFEDDRHSGLMKNLKFYKLTYPIRTYKKRYTKFIEFNFLHESEILSIYLNLGTYQNEPLLVIPYLKFGRQELPEIEQSFKQAFAAELFDNLPFTSRQWEVIKLAGKGFSIERVAKELHIGKNAVQKHNQKIKKIAERLFSPSLKDIKRIATFFNNYGLT